ncbi:AAA family ATPase [Methylomonas paludis]|uniref:AAA family ATPase n=1 Tax=Methylomonas paludis TaxID=1173101 RepID=A0A975R8S5_9GAMM|nr:MoxR family ATPase [Methylomonas paludis]QWF70322.1 AAA family ATPase [Methylomonas paludis]
MNNQTQPSPSANTKTLHLPATGTWPEAAYLLDENAQNAIALAVACGRPLLVRGLPGTGKSDLARAAAEYLGRAFIYEVVTARTEPQDLLWRFDAIARLADAQALGAGIKPSQATGTDLDVSDPRNYVSPGVLWWAIDWSKAENHLQDIKRHSRSFAQRPDKTLQLANNSSVNQQHRAEAQGCVLLLDEIDKADAELPNSLLEVLANTGFRLPWDGEQEIKADPAKKPLIIITTNEDRELPAAFVRRCLVLTIEPEGEFKEWIKQRAKVHFRNNPIDDAILESAAELLTNTRNNPGLDSYRPGLAEYLDLLRGLQALATDKEGQEIWLNKVSKFAYQKNPAATR